MKIDNENRRIESMLRFDIAVLLIFLFVFISISIFVFIHVINIAKSENAGAVFVAAFFMAVAVSASTVIWVIMYLRRCKRHVYEDELIFKELAKDEKEG